jgi:hypothetical protein
MTRQARAARAIESNIKTHHAYWVLRTVFIALALTGPATAQVNDAGSAGAAGGAGADASGILSSANKPVDAAPRFNALDLNVYGLAYHPDREAVHRLHLDNEFNPGLGLHYELVNNDRGITFTEVGAYRDSGSNWAKFAALGYQFKLGERWRIGGAVAVAHSRTYNQGATFVGMIPLLTYDMGSVKLNAVYFPKIPHYNEVDAFGFYISIPLGRGKH